MRSKRKEDVAIRIAVTQRSNGNKELIIFFYNGQEKLFTTGRARVFRKGDLLYISDDLKGNAVSGQRITVSKRLVIEDIEKFKGYYPMSHFGGGNGRIYLDLNDKMDIEPKPKKEPEISVEEWAAQFEKPIKKSENVAISQHEEKPSNLAALLTRAVKQGKIEVAQAFVVVMDWMNQEGMEI